MVTEMIGGDELELLLRRQEVSNRDLDFDRERELNLYRSGSAPPTIEGSLAAMGGVTEEDLLSNPAYLTFYYSQGNFNPRLPPPVLSKEDWRFSQRLQSGLGGIGDKRRSNRAEEQGSSSLFSMQPGFHQQKESEVGAGEWLDMRRDGLIGLTGLAAGRQKSLADMFQQDDLGHTTPVSSRPSRPASRNAFSNGIEPLGSGEDMLALHHEIGSLDGLHPGVQNNSATAPHTFASVVGKSLSRSNTPDPQLIGRTPSPSLPPVGVRLGNIDKRNNGSSSVTGLLTGRVDSDDLVTALSGMNLSANGGISKDILFDPRGAQDYIKQHSLLKKSDPEQLRMSSLQHLAQSSFPDLTRNTAVRVNGHIGLQKSTLSSPNSYPRSPSSPSITSPAGSPAHYLNMDDAGASFNSYGLNGYSLGSNNLPLFENGSPSIDSRGALGGFPSGSNLPGAHQMPLADPLYIQYLRAAEFASQSPGNFGNPSMERGYMGNSYADLLGIQKAYLGALLQPPKQYGMPFVGKSGDLNNDYYGNPAFGVGMPYPGSPLASHVLPGSPVAPGSPLRHGERAIRYQSGLSNFAGGVMGSWHSDPSGHLGDNFQPSLVEEFKINKAKCYELSDIADHVVEFSADQFGSRFIQQKLETATPEEKNMVFEEIMPQALMLMTDVFGNYVIQKFFEHGSAAQIRELADKLIGHVLTLSLHMYGCRVIQKAIEVVDLDQQTRMVSELDGHVMKCVHDQNGNHVIQKCIECVPGDAIQFIISSFYDQVVTLSTHPYGCRVIQRVLEHCDDPKIQQIMMTEIMASVCKLAQDQYGNYVVQHLLEHGKPHERSDIIKKLAGQIVQMSQQKFASNVVEKCLLFGGPEERQVLVSEMLGSTEENEPLQAMMKDQFANYVVQKVLETSDEQQREHILSRIKVHLNALKKYTYGKHIVARVEKLVAAGERRIGVQSPYTSLKA